MRRVRRHSPVQIRVVPSCDLRHLGAVCCFSKAFYFLLGRFVFGRWVRELERCGAAAGAGVRPYAGRGEAGGVFDVFGHFGGVWTGGRGRGWACRLDWQKLWSSGIMD
jgi:hypothetical protein